MTYNQTKILEGTATHWTAWRVGFRPQLGHPWFEIDGWPVYYPPFFFWWWHFYDTCAPPIFIEGFIITASCGFISIAVAILMTVWRRARHLVSIPTGRRAGRGR